MNRGRSQRVFAAIAAAPAIGLISGCVSTHTTDEPGVSAMRERAPSNEKRYIVSIHNEEPFQEIQRLLRDSNWSAVMQYYVLDGVPDVVLRQMKSGNYFQHELPFIDGVDNAVVYRPFPPHGTLRGPLASGWTESDDVGLIVRGTHIVEAFFLIDGVDPRALAGGLDVGSVYHVRFLLTRRGYQLLP